MRGEWGSNRVEMLTVGAECRVICFEVEGRRQ